MFKTKKVKILGTETSQSGHRKRGDLNERFSQRGSEKTPKDYLDLSPINFDSLANKMKRALLD